MLQLTSYKICKEKKSSVIEGVLFISVLILANTYDKFYLIIMVRRTCSDFGLNIVVYGFVTTNDMSILATTTHGFGLDSTFITFFTSSISST